MQIEFSMAWGMIVILISIIITSGAIIALVFRRMQERQNQT